MTLRLFACSLCFGLLALHGAPAHAEDPIVPVAQPQPPPAAQPPAEQPPPPPGYATNPPPPAYGTPPPPQQGPMQPGSQVVVVEQGGYGGYGYAPQPYGYGYADPRELQYQQARKSVWLAVLFDAILPGLGNIYAGEVLYSIVTWAGLSRG